MRICLGIMFIAVVGVVLIVFANPFATAVFADKPNALPPLEIDRSQPLLLLDPAQNKPKIKADNSACYVCHVNYEEEPFVVAHAVADVGCAKCHGKSQAHQDDEDHLTAPAKMFARDNVAKMCGECHDSHDVPASKIVQRWQEKCSTTVDPGKLTCTDCHGEHRLAKRKYIWNKQTGELLKKTEDSLSEGME